MIWVIALKSRRTGVCTGYFDGSATGASTDRTRAIQFEPEDLAERVAAGLRTRYPLGVINIEPDERSGATT